MYEQGVVSFNYIREKNRPHFLRLKGKKNPLQEVTSLMAVLNCKSITFEGIGECNPTVSPQITHKVNIIWQ